MNIKKILFSLIFITTVTMFFSQDMVFPESAEDIDYIAGQENDSIMRPEIQALNLKKNWNLYYYSGEESALEAYVASFSSIVLQESYSLEIQSYVVSEILFYTMFSRPYCGSSTSSLDSLVTVFLEKFALQDTITDNTYNAIELFQFLVKKSKKYISVNEALPFNLPIEQTSIVRSKTSEESIRYKLYQSLASAESLHQRLEKTRSAQKNQQAVKLSSDAFYRFISNPSSIFVVFHNERYSGLLDAFIRACSSYLSLDYEVCKNILLPTEDYDGISVFPKGFYSQIYSKIPKEKQDEKTLLLYFISDLFYESAETSRSLGYPLDLFLDDNEFQNMLYINDNPFYITCLSLEELQTLYSSLHCAVYSGIFYTQRINNLVTGNSFFKEAQ